MKKLITEEQRKKLHEIIYEADTPAGRLFDIILLSLILISIIAIMLESIASVQLKYGFILAEIEWIITAFFTLEYIARIIAVREPRHYIFSFYGIIDLLATIPKYIGLLFPGFGFLLAIRAIRLLRVFRILKLIKFVGAGNNLAIALKKSRAKIFVFLFTVMVLSIILGTLMYMIEGPENGFTSIPKSVYWTIVTLTTVGFGDITPHTPLGQLLSVVIMVLGYGIIAVPTGIVTSELANQNKDVHLNTQSCPNCGASNHKDNAEFCYNCGTRLH